HAGTRLHDQAFAAAAGARGTPGAPGGGPPDGFTSALRAPECWWNVRVGENSPSLWPTMFSLMKTGMNLRPLWTANVWPIMSGMIVERRDQVFVTLRSPAVFIAFTFFKRCSSTKGPFLTERATNAPCAYFLRRMTMKRFVRLLCRVL